MLSFCNWLNIYPWCSHSQRVCQWSAGSSLMSNRLHTHDGANCFHTDMDRVWGPVCVCQMGFKFAFFTEIWEKMFFSMYCTVGQWLIVQCSTVRVSPHALNFCLHSQRLGLSWLNITRTKLLPPRPLSSSSSPSPYQVQKSFCFYGNKAPCVCEQADLKQGN